LSAIDSGPKNEKSARSRLKTSTVTAPVFPVVAPSFGFVWLMTDWIAE